MISRANGYGRLRAKITRWGKEGERREGERERGRERKVRKGEREKREVVTH